MTSKPLDYIDTWTTPVPSSLSLIFSLSLLLCFHPPSVSTNLSVFLLPSETGALRSPVRVKLALSVMEGVR